MRVAFMLVAVVLLVLAAASARFIGYTAEVESVDNAVAPVAIPSTLEQTQEAGPDVKLVLLALWPEGFETNEMQLDAGEYLFIIGNRTALRDVKVQLLRDGKERLAAATLGGRLRDMKQRVRLTPGTYVVTANDDPNWICRITVG